MKVISFVILCALAAAVKGGMTKEEIKETFRTLSASCITDVGATEGNNKSKPKKGTYSVSELTAQMSDFEVMSKGMPATNMETKCLRACVMKKLGVINFDGKFDKASALKVAEMHIKGDAEKMKIANDIGSACESISVPDDHCEAAEMYKMCMAAEAKKLGINCMFD